MFRGLVVKWFGRGRNKTQEGTGTTEAAGEAGQGEDEPVPWITILEVFDVVQATLARARLEDAGIPVRIRQEGASSAIPVNVGILGRIQLRVPEPVAAQSLAILSDVSELDGDDFFDVTD